MKQVKVMTKAKKRMRMKTKAVTMKEEDNLANFTVAKMEMTKMKKPKMILCLLLLQPKAYHSTPCSKSAT